MEDFNSFNNKISLGYLKHLLNSKEELIKKISSYDEEINKTRKIIVGDLFIINNDTLTFDFDFDVPEGEFTDIIIDKFKLFNEILLKYMNIDKMKLNSNIIININLSNFNIIESHNINIKQNKDQKFILDLLNLWCKIKSNLLNRFFIDYDFIQNDKETIIHYYLNIRKN